MKKHLWLLRGFGTNVKNRRKELGLTQEELAEKSELDRTTIGKIEGGQGNVRLENIAALAEALQVHPSELLETE